MVTSSAPSKRKLDARKMMEKAIEVMKQSINEPRADGKPSPLVGAVLVKPDGSVDTACRGELRHGDHAEFTLLERKHRQERRLWNRAHPERGSIRSWPVRNGS
jgi:ATP-dependent DNA helicase RecG